MHDLIIFHIGIDKLNLIFKLIYDPNNYQIPQPPSTAKFCPVT